MRYIAVLLIAFTISTVCKSQSSSNTPAINAQPVLKFTFADVNEAAKLLKTEDDFIKSLSNFDRSARYKTSKTVSKEDFLKFVSSQARPWSTEEENKIKNIGNSLQTKLKSYKLNLPEPILLIKTTGNEEGHAAYCRQGAMIIPQNELKAADDKLENLITHELFHILIKANPELKESLYGLIHFKKCVDLTLPPDLKQLKITNPDSIFNDHYISLSYNNTQLDVIPFIFSRGRYNDQKNDEFFAYLTFKLLVVKNTASKTICKLDNNSRPIMLDVAQVPDFITKVGQNTQYIISPEEILADNFVLLINQNSQVNSKWLLDAMDDVLKKWPRQKIESGEAISEKDLQALIDRIAATGSNTEADALKACSKLIKLGIKAFDALVANANDPRPAWNIFPYQEVEWKTPPTVGQMCVEIISAQVEEYSRWKTLSNYFDDINTKNIAQWWAQNKGKSLKELQIMAVEGTIQKLKEQENRKPSKLHESRIKDLESKLQELQKN